MDPHVIVGGGGILGAATAFRLAQGGARVTQLDAGPFGRGASLVGFAWLYANDKPPFAYHALNVAGMHEYPALRREFGAAPWLHLSGNVEWLQGGDGPLRLRQKVERLREWGYPVELLPIGDLPRFEPDLLPPADLEEFAFFPDEGYVDLLPLIADLVGTARAAGAVVRPRTRVVGFLHQGDRVAGIETAAGERLAADAVVACAGAASDQLVRLAGLDLPLAPTVGMVAVTAPAAVRLRGVHHDGEMNIRPDGTGRVMIGHHAGFDARVRPGAQVHPALLNDLRDHGAGDLPGLAGVPIETARVTHRPISGDGYPAVGPAPGAADLDLTVAHSTATLGPLLGRLVAAEILTGAVDPRLHRFRPDRLLAARK